MSRPLLPLDAELPLGADREQVVDLVAILCGHALDAVILVIGPAIVDVDLASLRLAAHDGAGHRDQ